VRFLILGLGGWISPPLLDTVSVLVDVDNTLILLDCGECVVKQLTRLNIDFSKLRLVVLTHVHGDHILGFPTLVLWLKHLNSSNKVRVLGLPEVLETAVQLVKLTGIEKYLDIVRLIPIDISESGVCKVLEDDKFELHCTVSDHTVRSIAVKVIEKSTGLALTYTSDTRPSDRIIELAENTDVLIHEASCCDPAAHMHGHSTLRDAIIIAKRARAKVLVPVHYYVTGEVLACGDPEVCILVPSPGVWYDVNRIVNLCSKFGKS